MVLVVCNLWKLVYEFHPKISDLKIEKDYLGCQLDKFLELAERLRRTVKDIVTIIDLIKILRFVSASSNFSIHLSTCKSMLKVYSLK